METEKMTVTIGNLSIGPGQPKLIQSMCNVSTMDTEACVEQCIGIFEAGGGLARLSARNIKEARNLKIIREELNSRGYPQPISADVHFNPSIAFEAATVVEKVRINPGNFADGDIETPFMEFLDLCRKHNTAIRIGVNHGSLSERILEKYGDSPQGMVESALEYLRICKREDFSNVIVSLKSSNTRVMIYSNRLMRQRMEEEKLEYPLHLGVTEAGDGEDGRVRSAVGIGTLLLEGLGDTIRVSLTEDPEAEIPVAEKLLKATGLKAEGNRETEIIEFKRRDSFTNGSIGGGQVPVVIAEIDENSIPDPSSMKGSSDTDCFHVSDFDFVPDHRLLEDLPADRLYIMNYEAWVLDHYILHNFFPLFDLNGFITREKESGHLNLIIIRPEEVTDALERLNAVDIPLALVFMHDSEPLTRETFKDLADGTYHPIFIQADYNETDLELFQIKAAAELAWYFIDGHADGLWLDNPFAKRSVPRSTAFKILQACRARMSETEYIACPSCGRTLFNIQERLSEVRKTTSHLTHLKIAVMGCIVNGPGEMADADYGYVGAGKGKVSLYKSRELVKKNIPEQDAVEELIKLIKDNGDWKD
ncbi:(E)-4-hydroxy-3-methylbut-2-enyl-diphosphate synthase [Bacteroidota bacterium]